MLILVCFVLFCFVLCVCVVCLCLCVLFVCVVCVCCLCLCLCCLWLCLWLCFVLFRFVLFFVLFNCNIIGSKGRILLGRLQEMAEEFSREFGLYCDLEELLSLITDESNENETATANMSSQTFLVDVCSLFSFFSCSPFPSLLFLPSNQTRTKLLLRICPLKLF
jgi:hypothetical protein